MKPKFKTGIGFDAHKLVSNRKLILGGVDIPYKNGLLGHSDADVLCHAIADSILGAAKLGDIGEFFPDSDPRYKDVSSLFLLSEVKKIIETKNYEIIDIDSVIVAQAPRLSKYRQNMRENISSALNIDVDCVGIKASTTEHLGYEGRGEGISAFATCMLSRQ